MHKQQGAAWCARKKRLSVWTEDRNSFSGEEEKLAGNRQITPTLPAETAFF